jgi:hypothetical protein
MRYHINIVVSMGWQSIFGRRTSTTLYSQLERYLFTDRGVYLSLFPFTKGVLTLLVFGWFRFIDIHGIPVIPLRYTRTDSILVQYSSGSFPIQCVISLVGFA